MTTAYVPPATAGGRGLPSPGDAVSHTLLNCLLREVAAPRRWAALSSGHLVLRLPPDGTWLRVAVRRVSALGAHRFAGPVCRYAAGRWTPISWEALAGHTHAALTAHTGVSNDEFPGQVAASHDAVAAALALPRPAGGPDPRSRYLASERSLVFGHRFHPAPKAREAGTDSGAWEAYAPETGAVFPVRLLAVREALVAEERAEPGGTAPLDALGQAPAGYRLLPVHPWQYELLHRHPVLRTALQRGDVRDLGVTGTRFAATASVRTLYDGDSFLKFSLNVRITNCLRKNAVYELQGAVALTRLLEPVAADLTARFPGHAILREPAFRSVALPGTDGTPDPDLLEGFGVIVREGLAGRTPPGATALLAAAVADEYPTGPAHISRLLPRDAGPAAVLHWWQAYLGLLVPPVLAAWADHGVVLEPHLQNVLVCVGGDGMPAGVLFRDLEGTKLLRDHHAEALDTLPRQVAEPLTYDSEQGWTRLAYCLFVNNIGDMLAALADVSPGVEPELWSAVRRTLAAYGARHGRHPRIAALLAGEALPAKANLLTRWRRAADSQAAYVRLPSPLAPAGPQGAAADGAAGAAW
ncbi:iron transporter [Streptomyces cocklensis]|uniref:Siderophore synthetase component n=1 Tax=Actinacidiphila cocklensis TaxID=887465 RepID=A0A9W4GN57_9ACTN|nr:IucA/IucC family protein [Actinacidiphila cocklensis]MDD1063568.1 iron transporter [Actinacidiphila cocklensis]CAG6391018.1 Siderophore synthetase component [Actinacidiphila cocklensis]